MGEEGRASKWSNVCPYDEERFPAYARKQVIPIIHKDGVRGWGDGRNRDRGWWAREDGKGNSHLMGEPMEGGGNVTIVGKYFNNPTSNFGCSVS